jgi:GTP-binding protein HflX
MSEEEKEIRKKVVQEAGLPNEVSFISVTEGTGLNAFVERLHEFFLWPVELKIDVPMEDGISSTLSWLHDNAQVDDIRYGKAVRITLRCHEAVLGKIQERIENLGGKLEVLTT